MTEHAVVIAGAGPTGLMLAGELALAKIDVAVVERRASQDLPGSRAGGLHARTIEVLDQRGIAERFLAEGKKAQVAGFAATKLDISDFPTRHPYGLGLWQNHIERILAAWVGELAVTFYRGREVTGFTQDDTGVDIALSDGQGLRATYLVGCDGGRSLIRKAAGIDFPGWDPTTSALLAQVEMTEEPRPGIHRTPSGTHALGKVEYEIKDGEVVYGLRNPQSDLDHPVHRHDPAGRDLSLGTGLAGRRRGACAFPGRRTGPQHGCAGRGESWMEAGAGGQGDISGEPPRYLPRRAPPGGCPRPARHDGASRAHAPRRSDRGGPRCHC
jgi:2-polyprenyl-6-methoxyphenol hydroxylase-like FAD-dependent oxidoreductase